MMSGMAAKSRAFSKEAAVVDAVLRIVADRGLDQVSVREVAIAAEVSIGTVQHYFPSKDLLLAAAYREVLQRIRSRIAAVVLGDDLRTNLTAVLSELLPLDRRRVAEIRVHLAFAARAATMPPLAATQRAALTELHDGVTLAFARAAGGRGPSAESAAAAHAAMAVVDGLALHAVSSGGWLTRSRQLEVLAGAVDALMAAVQRRAGSVADSRSAINEPIGGQRGPSS
jgi:AcrR family transcriptional regulator